MTAKIDITDSVREDSNESSPRRRILNVAVWIVSVLAVAQALFPLLVGLFTAFVGYNRWQPALARR